MKRNTTLKRRKPLRKVSKARQGELAIYAKLAQSWLQKTPFCECPKKFGGFCVKRATGIHHIRGRSGKLLNDTRYFMAICHDCHHWIHHENPNAARKLGVLQF